jgi:hypothetical protein
MRDWRARNNRELRQRAFFEADFEVGLLGAPAARSIGLA